jgi:hypothetical protein
MNRHLCRAAVLVLAVAGFAVSEGRAQAASRASRGAQVEWQAERAFHLTRIMERARASLNDALLRIEIGTLAPIDADATRQAVAQMEALIKADSARTSKPAKTGPEIAALRIKLAEALNALDLAQVKFDNGMVTTKTINDAYFGVINLLLS